MDRDKIKELIDTFEMKNDLTENFDIWVGHAKIGYRNRPSIEQAIEVLKGIFDTFIDIGEPTPEELEKTMAQWENFHPYQKVRELDQPMFISKNENSVVIAVIWPWQIKEGVASLMIYEGKFIG